MSYQSIVKDFYLKHVPGARVDKNFIKAPCPFCASKSKEKPGLFVVYLNPESLFYGYFRCMNRCRPGGFPLYYCRLVGIDPEELPDYDPDRETFVRDMILPIKNLKQDILKFESLMSDSEYDYFSEFGVSSSVVNEMKIGYNGRYLVYPYFLEDGNGYAARCVLPSNEEDSFWHGNEKFFTKEFQIYDVAEIERCEGGALFLAAGENNHLVIREMGYPAIAVPSATDLEILSPERLAEIKNVYIAVGNTPEEQLSARTLAARLGFKARILKWPVQLKRGYTLAGLAREKGKDFRKIFLSMMGASKSFSPFASPEKEHRKFSESLERDKGKELLGLRTGFQKMDLSLNGIRGINIMGGPPKAGKSCFFMQVSTEMAKNKIPVIYYDFENGRQKIYSRTLCRLSRVPQKEIQKNEPDPEIEEKVRKAHAEIKGMLRFFRVVTDRELNPEIMRRQIDYIQHETRRDDTVVVIDSLHKLPFKDLSDRRTGIDSWLRNMESIRDEQNVAFFVISELSRDQEAGGYSKTPDMGAFKESGDIEYSADNAMILQPDWDPFDSISTTNRASSLWLVASRENNPGKVATYQLQYPLWGFKEL